MSQNIFSFDKSLNSLKWELNPPQEDIAIALSEEYCIPYLTALIMAARGINKETAGDFIHGTLKKCLPDPFILKDMEKASKRVAAAIENGEKIGLFSDYDVDGATSAAVLYLFFKKLGIELPVIIPERAEGYGPNISAMEDFIASGVKVIITADCGTNADIPLNFATEQGADVIVLDHHDMDKEHVPNVLALVNPKRLDEEPNHPCRIMAAVGVVFMFTIALNRELRQRGFYSQHNIAEPDLMSFIDLVAFGTICDVVDLTGINRLLVKIGLRCLNKSPNLGIRVLSDACNIDSLLSVYHLGFVLGPRINAGGRVGSAKLGQRLLCSDSELEAENIASELCSLNDERKDIEAFVLTEAIHQIESKVSANPDTDINLVFAYGDNWSDGVIGIVAGRLKERYHLPSVVLSVDGEVAHASCRSVLGIDIGAAIVEGVGQGILLKGGGHSKAAGFSVSTDKLAEAEDFLSVRIKEQLLANSQEVDEGNTLHIDALLDVGALSSELMDSLSLLEPFGEGNPEPIFALKDVNVFFLDIKGAGHVFCRISSRSGKWIKGVAFKSADTLLGQSIMKAAGEPFTLAGYLRMNEWQGRSIPQFIIIDGARS